MAYVKQSWVNGVSPVSASRLNHIEEGIEAAVDQETADATYVRSVNGIPVDPETGNVNVAASGGGSSGIHLDTDGVPYFDPSISGGAAIVADTDGVPYLA